MPEKIVWLKAKCPVCGRNYDYIEGGYFPKTCNDIVCLHKYLYDPKYQFKPLKDVKQ